MEDQSKDLRYSITVNEEKLNTLLRELLDGCRDDLEEVQQNLQFYLEEILAAKDGKQLYGQLYNDALKIKGLARQRQLALINMFKDRLTTKEKMELDSGKNVKTGATSMTPDMMVDAIEDVLKSKELTKVQVKKENIKKSKTQNKIEEPIDEDVDDGDDFLINEDEIDEGE